MFVLFESNVLICIYDVHLETLTSIYPHRSERNILSTDIWAEGQWPTEVPTPHMALQIIYAPNIYTAHSLSQHKLFYAPVGGFHAMKKDESHYTGLDLLVWTVLPKQASIQVQIILVGFVEGLKSVAPWAKAQSSLGRGHPWGWWVWNQQSRVFKAPEGGGLCLEVTLGLWPDVCVLQSRIKTLPPCTMEKRDRRREKCQILLSLQFTCKTWNENHIRLATQGHPFEGVILCGVLAGR